MMDRRVRIILGIVLIAYGIYSGNVWFYLGAIPLVMGLINWCPMEIMMGTCDPKSGCCTTTPKETNSSCCTPADSASKPTVTPSSWKNEGK